MSDRWYPNPQRLATPEKTNAVLKEVLDRHYELADKVNAMGAAKPESPIIAPTAASFGGPATSKLLGLPVGPSDVQKLADGATLKYVRSKGLFLFS